MHIAVIQCLLPVFHHLSKDVDLLYHEATFDGSMTELAKQVKHSTTLDAARTALKAGAGTLMIGHFSARYKEITGLVDEARTIFPNTIPAIDGTTYDLRDLSEIRLTTNHSRSLTGTEITHRSIT